MQGLGAAILSPAALSIVAVTFKDGAERNKALGMWGAVAGSGGAAGVLLGGVLTEYIGWEWVLWVNVPIGILAAAIAPTLIAETTAEAETRHFDIAGAVTITLGLSAFVFALLDAESAGWGSAQTIGTIVASLILLGAFVAVELRSRAPLVPFSIFRVRTVTGANVVGILVGASLFSMFYFISLYMQQILGYSPIKAGISYLPLAVTIILAAGLASGLVTEVGFKPILAIGMACIAAGLLWFTQIDVHGSFLADILGPSLLAALGLGFAFVPVTIAAVSGIEDREQGLASGLINTSQQVGGALGLAILAAVANSVIGSTENAGEADRRLPGRLRRGRRLRDRRPDRHPRPGPQRRQPRPRRTRQRGPGAGRVGRRPDGRTRDRIDVPVRPTVGRWFAAMRIASFSPHSCPLLLAPMRCRRGDARGARGRARSTLEASGPVSDGKGAASVRADRHRPAAGGRLAAALAADERRDPDWCSKGAGWARRVTTVGFQACDDSSPKTGLWTKAICRANAKAYAADTGVLAVIGTYNSGCAEIEIPSSARHPAAGRDGLARQHRDLPDRVEPRLQRRHPGSLYPKAHNYARVVPNDAYQGAGLASFAKREGVEERLRPLRGRTTRPASARRRPSRAPRRRPGSRCSASPPGTRRRRATRR